MVQKQEFAADHLKDRVSQKFQAFVASFFIPVALIGIGAVGQGMGKKVLVFKGISDDLLQHFQFFIQECFLLIMENGAGAKESYLSIPFAAAPDFRDFRKGLI